MTCPVWHDVALLLHEAIILLVVEARAHMRFAKGCDVHRAPPVGVWSGPPPVGIGISRRPPRRRRDDVTKAGRPRTGVVA
eukprot:scaffold238850_cov21-Tisochrysis_lutea.AAC.1